MSYAAGQWHGNAAPACTLRDEQGDSGRILLRPRISREPYTVRHCELLERAASTVVEAVRRA
jgi:hypothetical protein